MVSTNLFLNSVAAGTFVLYASIGPPSVAVRILLDQLQVPYEFIYVKYYEGETLGEEFGKVCDLEIDNKALNR
jgi:hypothetical protein